MTTKKEFDIGKHIKLKLINNKTKIFVNDNEILGCKHLVVDIPIEKLKKINSIDELAKKYSNEKRKLNIDSEEEFWGHCSNIQTWYENNFMMSMIHTKVGFPLLKELGKLEFNAKQKLIEYLDRKSSRFTPRERVDNGFGIRTEEFGEYNFTEEEIKASEYLTELKKLVELKGYTLAIDNTFTQQSWSTLMVDYKYKGVVKVYYRDWYGHPLQLIGIKDIDGNKTIRMPNHSKNYRTIMRWLRHAISILGGQREHWKDNRVTKPEFDRKEKNLKENFTVKSLFNTITNVINLDVGKVFLKREYPIAFKNNNNKIFFRKNFDKFLTKKTRMNYFRHIDTEFNGGKKHHLTKQLSEKEFYEVLRNNLIEVDFLIQP